MHVWLHSSRTTASLHPRPGSGARPHGIMRADTAAVQSRPPPPPVLLSPVSGPALLPRLDAVTVSEGHHEDGPVTQRRRGGTAGTPVDQLNIRGAREDLARGVVRGLRSTRAELPGVFFLDDRGNRLFEEICASAEYYPPRAELHILEAHAREIGALAGERCCVIEHGGGAGARTSILLENLRAPAAYVQIDPCKSQLLRAATALATAHPWLDVKGVCADPLKSGKLALGSCARRLVFCPGAPLQAPSPAADCQLQSLSRGCSPGDHVLLGVDLKKDPILVHRAYNDALGLFAELGKNALVRLQRELGVELEVDQFEHYAFYHPGEGRVELHLVSLREQSLTVGGETRLLRLGESLWTANAYKYGIAEIAARAAAVGFTVEGVWMDARRQFSLQLLRRT